LAGCPGLILILKRLVWPEEVTVIKPYRVVLTAVLLFLLIAGCALPGSPPTVEPEQKEREEADDAEEPVPPEDRRADLRELEFVIRMSVEPAQLDPGESFWVHLDGADADEVQVYFLDERRPVYPMYGGAAALIGVSYFVEPGEYEVTAKVDKAGNTRETSRTLEVIEREFEVQHLQVTGEQESQRSSDLWEEDRPHMIRSRAETAPHPLYTEEFIWPVQGRITTEFGVIRYINDRESGRHSGLDIAAPTGTPVLAANSGRVTLSEDLNVPGRTVVIDHGLNLFTVYYHLDERIAEEGDEVELGDVIGEVGSTGFSTGPHLHLTFSVGEVPVNPWSYLESNPLEAALDASRRWEHRHQGPVPVP